MTRTVSGPSDRVVVVGAGFAGLAAALHLAGRGRQVTVVERGPVPGGRAGRMTVQGHRFDTGPSVLTMPDIIDETLAAVGADRGDLRLVELDPSYDARFADGTSLRVHRDPAAMEQAIHDFAGPRDADGYRRLRAWLEQLYRVEFDKFVASNYDSPLSLVSPQLARVAAMGGFGRLHRVVGRFIADERVRRLFTFQSLYVGVAPQQALALYALIAYMDTAAGVFFPSGGISAIPDALAAAAVKAGVTFHYRTDISALERRGRRVTTVRATDGRQFSCDAVVLTTELTTSYRLLGRRPRRLVRLKPAPSAVVVHLGTSSRFDALAHHTISFGAAWRSTFTELIQRQAVMSDPSLLITRPTATDALLAPPGGDTLSILAPVPHLDVEAKRRLDWDRIGCSYADQLIELTEQRVAPGLGTAMTCRQVITPADWARQGLTAGTPFAYSHTFAQTGPFRPGNLPAGADNVVLAGGGTVPGVGVPTALISGRLAADRITGKVEQR